MIKIEGTLRVKKILQSKNGPFAVGTLTTEIGQFKVKDQTLDQFDEGTYQVTTRIVQVFLGHYIAAGRSIAEIRAHLQELQVQSEEPGLDTAAENEAALEPDPLDEPPPVKPVPAVSLDELKAKLKKIGGSRTSKDTSRAITASQAASTLAQAQATQDVRMCFSQDLWALIQARQPVKLDAAIGDRPLFRKQGCVLREQLGYRFNSLDQTFYPV